MKILQIFLLLFLFTSCIFQKKSEEKRALSIEASNKKGLESTVQESLNELIATVEFAVKANPEEVKDFEGGVIPWISIEKAKDQINRLIDGDKVVINYSQITLIIDYPLNKPAKFELKSPGKGFTKKQLALEISKRYHEIYEEEESSAKNKTVPVEKREGVVNRNETDGKYGIWGHDIGDLDLSSVEVYKTDDGEIQIVLGIES